MSQTSLVSPAYRAEDLGSIPGSGRSPGEEISTHSSVLACKILWAEEPHGLQSIQGIMC